MDNDEAAEFAEEELRRSIEAQEKKAQKEQVAQVVDASQFVSVPKQEIVKRKAELVAASDGVIVGRTIDEQWRVATALCDSGMVPRDFDTPAKVWVAMQFAYELGLRGVATAMRQICVINGRPALWGDLPLALCRRSGKLLSIKEWVYDEKGIEISPSNQNLGSVIFGAACRTVRVGEPGGEPQVLETWFTMVDATTAKLANKDIWKSYQRHMLKYRARSQNLKDQFGDVLLGAAIAEYDFDTTGQFSADGHVPGADAPIAKPNLSDRLNANLSATPEN